MVNLNVIDFSNYKMNEMDYLWSEGWNVVNEVDNVTRDELMSNDYVMICCKPITEQH